MVIGCQCVLFHFPDVVGFEQFGKVVILLLLRYLIELYVYRLVVSRCVNVADNTEGDGEAVFVGHHSQLQLQGVVLTMGVVYQYIIESIAVFADFHDLQAETFLHQTKFVVLTEHEFLAVAHINSVLLAAFLGIYRLVAAVVEDNAVLQNLANGSTLVLVSSLQDILSLGSISGNATGKEVTASTETEFSGAEWILYRAIGARLRNEATG